MKRTCSILMIMAILGACKKEIKQINREPDLVVDEKSGTANRVTQPCFYTPLVQQPDGSWTASFEYVDLTFRNLNIREGDWLYGDLVYADTRPILSGEEQSRTFSFKDFYCAVSGPMITKNTRTVTWTEFSNNSFGNNTYAYYGGSFSSVASFLLDVANGFELGWVDFKVTPNVYKVTTYRIGEGITEDCTRSKVVAGKLVVKSIQTPTGYQYEYGVANLCYEDQPKKYDPPPPPPPPIRVE